MDHPKNQIPFNKPFLSGKEMTYIRQAVENGQVSGNGPFTKKCHHFFKERFGFPHCLLTTSCTDALEMSALLLDLEPGDEIIVPSFTFVSTANAFALRGATVRFADCMPEYPNISASQIEPLLSSRTRAVVVVHYAGVACDMDPILDLSKKHGFAVIEDAAHALDATYKGRPLGTLGDLATFSFHETKNLIAGEGGMLVINRREWADRAEILWEKGTNRAAFFRNEVDKYNWVDLGSSFLPSDIIAAFLFGQLENLESIQTRRKEIWRRYKEGLIPLEVQGKIQLPKIPDFASQNGNLFFLLTPDETTRQALLNHLSQREIQAVFHYLPLHQSPFYTRKNPNINLPNCESFANNIVRLPFFHSITEMEQKRVIEGIHSFFGS